jgi:hypothetical protein
MLYSYRLQKFLKFHSIYLNFCIYTKCTKIQNITIVLVEVFFSFFFSKRISNEPGTTYCSPLLLLGKKTHCIEIVLMVRSYKYSAKFSNKPFTLLIFSLTSSSSSSSWAHLHQMFAKNVLNNNYHSTLCFFPPARIASISID